MTGIYILNHCSGLKESLSTFSKVASEVCKKHPKANSKSKCTSFYKFQKTPIPNATTPPSKSIINPYEQPFVRPLSIYILFDFHLLRPVYFYPSLIILVRIYSHKNRVNFTAVQSPKQVIIFMTILLHDRYFLTPVWIPYYLSVSSTVIRIFGGRRRLLFATTSFMKTNRIYCRQTSS